MRRALLSILALALLLPAAASARTYVPDGCSPGGVRPRMVVVFCGDAGVVFEKLRWSSFGGRHARARGVSITKSCDPSCAQGGVITRRVRLVFFRRRHCRGYGGRYYRRVRATTAAGRRFYGVPCPVG